MAEIISDNFLTIRFTDNQSGTGQNVEIDAFRYNGQTIPIQALAGDGPLKRDGYITSVELQSNFQDVSAVVLVDGQDVGLVNRQTNSLTLPQRVPVDQVSIQINAF